MIDQIKRFLNHFANDSLYRNSIYIMASTAVMASCGFFFWMINARLYTPGDIGLATALISSVTLITSLTVFGVNSGMIRFLPKTEKKNTFINTIFTLVGGTTFMGSIVYLALLPLLAPKLMFIRQNLYLEAIFVIFVTLSAINTVSDSVFIAYRATKYIFYYNALYSVSRVVFPIFLISLGVYGIFLAHSLGVIIALLATLFFMVNKFSYIPNINLNNGVLRKVARFSFASYFASFIGGLPSLIFPIIILNQLGAAISAYYYIVAMFVNLLNIIPLAISQSLFAESSHDEAMLFAHIKKSIVLNVLLLVPAVISTATFGSYFLLFFGKSYVAEGRVFLQIMALSVLLSPINNTFSIVFRIRNKLFAVNLAVAVGAIVTVILSFMLLKYKLVGVGIGIMLGQTVVMLVFVTYLLLNRRYRNAV